MDISIPARVSRALMFVSCATGVDASSHQYHAQGTNNIADRPATDDRDTMPKSEIRFSNGVQSNGRRIGERHSGWINAVRNM